jgi:hypothetical protein
MPSSSIKMNDRSRIAQISKYLFYRPNQPRRQQP